MQTQATRFGRPLPERGTIGIAAPASPYHNRSAVLRGVEWWEEAGYRVKIAERILDRDHWVAGSAEARAGDLMAMFADPEVDLVQSLQGGYGSAQLIPHLDFDALAEHPKPFVGYSDITSLHVALRQKSGLATFYGYGLVGMGDAETTQFTRDRWLAVLSGETTGEVPRDPDDPYVRAIAGGKATAPLVGGCLWLLMQTMGTPWELETRGCILFFEDVDLPTWQLDAFLVQLLHAGKLDEVAGVVVGEMHELRLAPPRLQRLRANEVGRGCARGAPRLARRPRPLPAPARARQALGRTPARSDGDARRGRTHADNRRAGARWVRLDPRGRGQGGKERA